MNLLKITRAHFAILLVASILLTMTACRKKDPDDTEKTTLPVLTQSGENAQTAFLGDNLYITDIGNYTGAYVEDGSDEIVSNVLMVVLKNEGESALQLARINLEYADFTANFEVTNLPAGESVVLLEKNRHAYVSDHYLRATAENVVFFQKPMSIQKDKVKLTGSKGSIQVENISNDTLGVIYIYYKNSAVDLLYGGITYRAKVDAGLKPGKNTTVLTQHYNPDTCTIVNVEIMPVEE